MVCICIRRVNRDLSGREVFVRACLPLLPANSECLCIWIEVLTLDFEVSIHLNLDSTSTISVVDRWCGHHTLLRPDNLMLGIYLNPNTPCMPSCVYSGCIHIREIHNSLKYLFLVILLWTHYPRVHGEIEWGENQVVFVLGIDATVFLHVIFEIVGISCCNLELWNYSCWMLSFDGYTSSIEI